MLLCDNEDSDQNDKILPQKSMCPESIRWKKLASDPCPSAIQQRRRFRSRSQLRLISYDGPPCTSYRNSLERIHNYRFAEDRVRRLRFNCWE